MCRKQIALLVLLYGAVFAVGAQSKLPGDTSLSPRGVGPVRLGMTLKEASAASGTPLKKAGDPTNGIKYKLYRTEDSYFWVGVTDGRIHMACAATNRISTAEGIRKGDNVKKLGQISRAKLKHMKNPMHYRLEPTDPKDRGYVIWFEVLGDTIEEICAGTSTLHSYVMEGGT